MKGNQHRGLLLMLNTAGLLASSFYLSEHCDCAPNFLGVLR